MTDYLPYIFGTISFLGGIYLFLYFFKIYKPKYKNEEAKIKYEKTQARFGTISKFASIVMIISGGYDLTFHDIERYTITNSKTQNLWTKEDRDQLVYDCIQGAGETGEKYPTLIKEYCECSTDNIMAFFTRDQYIKDIKLTQDERMKEIIIKDKQKYLKENYPFLEIPELADRKHCIHCDRDIIVGNYKVFSEHGIELIYCPNAPDCNGTVIDWLDIK